MSKKARYLLGILLTIIVGCWLYGLFCCPSSLDESKNNDDNKTIDKSTIDKKNTTQAFLNKQGFEFESATVRYECEANFNFVISNDDILLPVSDSINFGILKLKEALGESNSKFKITGFYTDDESNNSIFPNLGLARANSIKNYLVEKGILEKTIELFGEVKEKVLVRNDTLIEPASFEWLKVDAKTATKDWAAVKQSINASPLTLYFNTGQSSIDLSQEQKEKIATFVDYLNHVEGSKISIIGHSDNQPGVKHSNQYYSEERAKFAKQYFVSHGISEAKIEASGKGETQPIVSNATEEGKTKNRRTEVTIK